MQLASHSQFINRFVKTIKRQSHKVFDIMLTNGPSRLCPSIAWLCAKTQCSQVCQLLNQPNFQRWLGHGIQAFRCDQVQETLIDLMHWLVNSRVSLLCFCGCKSFMDVLQNIAKLTNNGPGLFPLTWLGIYCMFMECIFLSLRVATRTVNIMIVHSKQYRDCWLSGATPNG